jgi:hypothetical protein
VPPPCSASISPSRCLRSRGSGRRMWASRMSPSRQATPRRRAPERHVRRRRVCLRRFLRRRDAGIRGRDVATRPSRRTACDHHLGAGQVRARVRCLLEVGARDRAEAVPGVQSWDEITTASALADLLSRGGVGGATVEATQGEHHELGEADEFWDIVLGSGYRGTVDALEEERRARLRERVLGELRLLGVTKCRTTWSSAGQRGVSPSSPPDEADSPLAASAAPRSRCRAAAASLRRRRGRRRPRAGRGR